MFKYPSCVSHSESPTCSRTFSSCAKCRDPAGARSEAGVLHILGSLMRCGQMVKGWFALWLHFRAWFKEVDNPIYMLDLAQPKKLPICYGADRFYKNTCQTKTFIQISNFSKEADDMKKRSFPGLTFVPAGVKYFKQFSILQWHSRSSCLPRWHCGRSCSRTDPRLKLPNPPPNTEHRLLSILPAHTLG